MIGICALWLLGAWLMDRRTKPQMTPITQITQIDPI